MQTEDILYVFVAAPSKAVESYVRSLCSSFEEGLSCINPEKCKNQSDETQNITLGGLCQSCKELVQPPVAKDTNQAVIGQDAYDNIDTKKTTPNSVSKKDVGKFCAVPGSSQISTTEPNSMPRVSMEGLDLINRNVEPSEDEYECTTYTLSLIHI